MPPFEDWNKLDDEEDEELQDTSFLETKKDVILFCIDCSPSMQKLREDPKYEDQQTCHLNVALETATEILKKKILVGPNDSAGVLMFNTTRRSESTRGQGSEIKKGTYLFQPIEQLSSEPIKNIKRLLGSFREDNSKLASTFSPLADKRIPMGDVFTSCNWVLRDGAPKTATKRVFLITDCDDPHPNTQQLLTSARTTLIDLTQSGVSVEPFFLRSDEETFDVNKFYKSVLLPTSVGDEDDGALLPESMCIARAEDLLDQMKFREMPKRAQFSIGFQIAKGFTIGVKGYGLVTEQKKGTYRYFVDQVDGPEPAESQTVYVDEDREAVIDKNRVAYGMELGKSEEGPPARVVRRGQRPFYTGQEVREFRTMGMEPLIKLIGFKDKIELAFEDNVKHSLFIHPDENTYAGSRRTFTALLRSMLAKGKIAVVLSLTRRNSSPTFCALVPQQEEHDEESGWTDPGGFHLIPLPYADDIRSAPVEKSITANDDLVEKARPWVKKLTLRGEKSGYEPDSYPNPSLHYHNAQLEAQAFREAFDDEDFVDETVPPYGSIHKKGGKLLEEWNEALKEDDSASMVVDVPAKSGTKRKADVNVDEVEIRARYDKGDLKKLTVAQLKPFLQSKSLPVSGKKDELIERVTDYLDSH